MVGRKQSGCGETEEIEAVSRIWIIVPHQKIALVMEIR